MSDRTHPMDISPRAVVDAVERWSRKADLLDQVRQVAQRPCCGECDGVCDAVALEDIRALLGVGT